MRNGVCVMIMAGMAKWSAGVLECWAFSFLHYSNPPSLQYSFLIIALRLREPLGCADVLNVGSWFHRIHGLAGREQFREHILAEIAEPSRRYRVQHRRFEQ